MMLPFKESIKKLSPYEPGRPIEEVKRELGLKHITKLASNENALGPSPLAIEAMKKAASQMHFYPEGSCYYIKKKLAKKLGIKESELIFGNGSNEIIEFIFNGFLREGDEVLSSEHAFAVYPILTKVYQGKYSQAKMKEFRFDLEGIKQKITPQTKIIFIANPNNPTGTYVTKSELEEFLDFVPEDVLICLDEAYFEFVDESDYPNGLDYISRKNVVVLRTFSKCYGLSGLRIGYGMASEEIIGYFHQLRQPFNVNAMAQAAVLAALDDDAYLQASLDLVKKGRLMFEKELTKRNIPFIPSVTNFVMIQVKDGKKVFDLLMKKGVIVRAMNAYLMPEYIRVTYGTNEQNREFFHYLDDIRSEVGF